MSMGSQSVQAIGNGLSSARPRGRFGLLDGLRLCAALGVVMYHFVSKNTASWGTEVANVFPNLSRIFSLGYYGVELFFVISGFVILMTAWGRDLPSYVASRISRLYPAYIFAVMATSTLLIWIWPGNKSLSVGQVAANLTMLQGAMNIENIDGVYWTLWAEFRFYVLIALLMVVGITRKRILAFAALWPICAALARSTSVPGLSTLLIPDHAAMFAGGMAIYLIARDRRDVSAWLVLALNALLSVSQVGIPAREAVLGSTNYRIPDAIVAVVMLLCFGLVVLATCTSLRSIHAKWLMLAGVLTYPLYLLHEWWGWWLIFQLHDRLSPLAVLILTVAIVLVAAWLVHRFVEKPLAQPLRRAIDKSLRQVEQMRTQE